MAFCTKCGKELAENEVCSCQQEAPVEAPQAAEAPKQQAPAAEKKNNKYVMPAVIGVVALLLIVLIVSLAGGKPYKKMLDNYVSLVNKKSTNAVDYEYALMAEGRVKLAKDLVKASKKLDGADEVLEEAKEAKEDQYEDLNDEYEKWKLSYEIKSAKKMDEKELKSYQKAAKNHYKDWIKPQVKSIEKMLEDDDDLEDYADDMDVSEKDIKKILKATLKQCKDLEDMKITAGYNVKVKFFVKTKDDEYKTEMVEIAVVKANGDWVYAGRAEDEEERLSFEESDLSALVSPLNKTYLYN